jgi:hypothetical protein
MTRTTHADVLTRRDDAHRTGTGNVLEDTLTRVEPTCADALRPAPSPEIAALWAAVIKQLTALRANGGHTPAMASDGDLSAAKATTGTEEGDPRHAPAQPASRRRPA